MKTIEELKNTVIKGDCLEVMKEIPDKSVDCIITSPPYNMRTRVRNGKYTTKEKSEHFSKKYSHFGDDLSIEEYESFHTKVLNECLRISSIVFWNIQIVTGSKEAVFKIIGKFAKNIVDIVVWDKGFGQPAMHSGVLNRGYELIIILEPNRKAGRTFTKYKFKRGELQDIWRLGRGGKGKIKIHTAVFPETLVETVLKNFTSENEIILDPFAGSGTTGVAAKNLNRNYILIEKEQEYIDIINKRLSN